MKKALMIIFPLLLSGFCYGQTNISGPATIDYDLGAALKIKNWNRFGSTNGGHYPYWGMNVEHTSNGWNSFHSSLRGSLILNWGNEIHFASTPPNSVNAPASIHMTIKTATGKVGIGTTSPSGTLDIVGDSFLRGRMFFTDPLAADPSTGTEYAFLSLDNDNKDLQFNMFDTSWESRVTFKRNGNVGIGTTSPFGNLEVVGSSNTALRVTSSNSGDFQVLAFRDNDASIDRAYLGTVATPGNWINDSPINSVYLTNNTAGGSIGFGNTANATTSMLINTSGDVGIGTTTPNTKLEVFGNSQNWNETNQGSSVGTIHLNPGSTNDHFGNSITFGASDVSAGKTAHAGIYVRSDGSYGTKMYFSTTNNYSQGSKTSMMINHNGHIGIGTTSSSGRLQVAGRSANWSETIQGLGTGTIHLEPKNTNDHFGNAITFGASDSNGEQNANAGIYVRSDGSYGTKMYFSTTNNYGQGSKTSLMLDYNGNVGIGTSTPGNKLEVNGTIRSKKVKVDANGWPDYVFATSYEP